MTLLPSFTEQRLEPVAEVSRWRLLLSWQGESAAAESGDFLATPEFDHRAAWSWDDGPASSYSGRASVRLASSSAAAIWLAERARRVPDFAPEAALALMVGDVPVVERVILRGRAQRWWIEPAAWRLEIEAAWPWDTNRLLCRDLALLPTGVASGIRGPRWIPQVFGEVDGVPLARLAAGDSVGLRVGLERTQLEAVLDRLPEGWPATGSVQINDETMTYTSIVDGPPRLLGLVRATPRDHAASARAMWLPTGGTAWIAADHEAEVLAMATATQPTLALAGATVDSIELDGRTATRVALDRWPVSRREGAAVVVEQEPSKASHWQLDAATSAQSPLLAWGEPDASDGTVFARGATTWRATSRRPADASMLRFGSIVRARLRCDVAFASTWSLAETLTLRVRRAAASVEKPLLRSEGVTRQLVGEVAVDAAGLGAIELPVASEMRRFATAVPFDNERWTNPQAAVDGSVDTVASLAQELGETAPLSLGLGSVAANDTRRVRRYVVHVWASLPGLTTTIRATLETPGFTVSATAEGSPEFAWLTLVLELPAGEHALADLLGEGSHMLISLEGESELAIGDVVLQVDYETASIDVPATPAALAVSASQAAPFATYELDVTSLLANAEDWAAFDGALVAEVQLASLVNGQRAEMRHLHWMFDVRPAAYVRLETELVARVRGRLAETDGLCEPVAVVETLWSEDDLLGQPAAALDAGATERAREVIALAGRRFRAAFAEGIATNVVMRRALAEGGLMLAPTEAGWGLRAVDALVALPLEATLVPGHVIAIEDSRVVEAPSLVVRRVIARRRDARVVADVDRGVGQGEQQAVFWWLEGGAASLVVGGFDRAGYRRERLRWRTRPAWWWTPLGARLGLDLPEQGLADRAVVVDRVEHRRGETWLEGWIAAPWSVTRLGVLEVRREFAVPRLVFVVGGRVWAMFDPSGDLRVSGGVTSDPGIGPFSPGPGYSLDAGDGLTFGTLGIGAMAVAPDGGLRVRGSLATGVALPGPGPANGWSVSAEGLTLGTPELGVVAFLDGATGDLSLRGQVRGLVD